MRLHSQPYCPTTIVSAGSPPRGVPHSRSSGRAWRIRRRTPRYGRLDRRDSRGDGSAGSARGQRLARWPSQRARLGGKGRRQRKLGGLLPASDAPSWTATPARRSAADPGRAIRDATLDVALTVVENTLTPNSENSEFRTLRLQASPGGDARTGVTERAGAG